MYSKFLFDASNAITMLNKDAGRENAMTYEFSLQKPRWGRPVRDLKGHGDQSLDESLILTAHMIIDLTGILEMSHGVGASNRPQPR